MQKNLLSITVVLLFLASCTLNKAKINNELKKHFDEEKVTGSFSLFNNQAGNVIVYNMDLDTLRLSPASSFNMINALIGLETGKIIDTVTTWDLNEQAVSLPLAFRQNNTEYFKRVARLVGKDTLQHWVDTTQYGNKNLAGDIDSFWLNDTLKISNDEQVGLMYELYFDKLPFSKYAQDILKGMMKQVDNTLYKYYYATGTGTDSKNQSIGWIMGWVEENRHVYFFSTYIQSNEHQKDMSETAVKIAHNILTELGYFKGEK